MSDLLDFLLRRNACGTRPTPSVARMALIALVLAVVLRGPYAIDSRADDAFYSEAALLWRQGLIPYVHAFDVKPPGIFAVLAAAQSLFGPNLLAIRAVGGLSDVFTMTLLLRFAWQRGLPEAGVLAAVLFAWYMSLLDADDCYGLLVALTTLAVMLAMSKWPLLRRAAAAGLAIGAASVVKQTAVFEGMAILLILTTTAATRAERWTSVALYVAGALLLPGICVVYFAFNGGLTAFLTDTIVMALQRPSAGSDNVSFLGGIGRCLQISLFLSPVLLYGIATALFPVRFSELGSDVGALRYWLTASLVSVVVQRALHAIYMTPVLPPALLLTAIGVGHRLETRRVLARLGLMLVVATLTITCLIRLATIQPEDQSIIDRASAAIRAAASADDRLYVIGANSSAVWLYVTTGLRPPLPFIIPGQQACDFPNVGPHRIDQAFAARPRFVVTDRENKYYICETENIASRIRAALIKDYRVIATITGQDEQYTVYERLSADKL